MEKNGDGEKQMRNTNTHTYIHTVDMREFFRVMAYPFHLNEGHCSDVSKKDVDAFRLK